MLNNLTTTINSCKACHLYTPSQKRKVIQLQPMLKAAFSFQECAANLFTLTGNEYIVLVDRLTGFLCCDKLQKTSTSAILINLTNWFNILGWPEKIRTDFCIVLLYRSNRQDVSWLKGRGSHMLPRGPNCLAPKSLTHAWVLINMDPMSRRIP